jgi:hypothetical protein
VSTVFISSVIKGFEEYRQAAKEAVELMDRKPVMSESFGARPYSSKTACIHEAEQSDVYLLILGANYGFETDEGLSVTQTEFRAARASGRPILAFVQQCEMESKQAAFRQEVEAYQGGVFRDTFSSPAELKDKVIQALRRLETISQAIPDDAFRSRIDSARGEIVGYHDSEPELILAFLPQPARMVDIVGLEHELDTRFSALCAAGLARIRDGYKPRIEAGWTGLETGKTSLAYYPDGLTVLLIKPAPLSDSLFSGHFVPPATLQHAAESFLGLLDSKSGHVGIELRNMENAYVADPPTGNTLTMRMWGDDALAFSHLFNPLTPGAYRDWMAHHINLFKRKFPYNPG